ncbi:hypothetical protein [Cohnella sp.]|uniref:hypothetical protein n=1 Tax=Cohnella sp. TaxID=1883426 RepID=UPI0035615C72
MGFKAVKLSVATLAAALLLTDATGLLATPIQQASAQGQDISKQVIKLNTKSSLVLRDAQFLMQDRGKVLAFTVTLTNNDTKDLNLLDYWLRIKNKSGKSYSVNVSGVDKNKTKLAAKSSINLTYYATVDDQTMITDLQFHVIKWDFSVKNYERKLGTITFPTATSEKITYKQSKVMIFDNSKVKGTIKNYVVSQDDSNIYLTINYLIENVGYKSSNFNKTRLFLQTDDQKVFEVEGEDLSKIIIKPQEKKSITLFASIPLESAKKGMSLTMANNDETNNILLPVGSFSIPYKASNQVNEQQKIGGSFTYNDFQVNLRSITRSPLDDSDMVIAEVKVTNKGTEYKPLPNLSGLYTINGIQLNAEETKTSVLDQVALLGPNSSYSYFVYSKIPYTTNIGKITFAITEKAGTEGSKTLYYFSDSRTSSVPTSNIMTSYMINSAGKKSEVVLKKSALYSGVKSDLLYVEFEYSNKESRSILPSLLGGYLQNENMITMPVSFSQYKEKIFPNGKVLLFAWADVPKKFTTNFADFVMGQNVLTNPPENTTESIALANSVKFRINKDSNQTTKNDFKKIEFVDSQLSLNNIIASVNVSLTGGGTYEIDGIRLDFKYDLEKIATYDDIAEKHNILLEIVDQDEKKATFTQKFSISTTEEGSDVLADGLNTAKSVVFKDADVMGKIKEFKKYKLNVYHLLNDNKFLLASKELSWYTYEN